MERRKRAAKEESGDGAPGWMVTYGDMMTLLLTFFVLLISFSSIQEVEFEKAMGSLKRALGVLPMQSGLQRQVRFYQQTQSTKEEILDEVIKMQEQLQENDLEGEVKIDITDKGVHIVISDPILFDLGSDRLKTEVVTPLDIVADLLRKSPDSEVLVEGHTDNWPIHSERFPTNWELSGARALAVVKYFSFKKGMSPSRFAATGFGEYRPIVPNDTPEHRAMNRRVEIFVNTKRNLNDRFPASTND